MVDVTVLGLSLQNESNLPALLLHPTGTRRILRIGVTPLEAVVVLASLHSPRYPDSQSRGQAPLVHEAFLNGMLAVGMVLDAVELVDFIEGEITARAIFARNGASVRIACRSADGVALALRGDAPLRCAEALLDKAEGIDAVMATLPPHVRALAVARLKEPLVADITRLPQAAQEALAARRRKNDPISDDDLISVAEKMMEEDAKHRAEALMPERGIWDEADEGAAAKLGEEKKNPSAPQIRVTMVRHFGKGEREIINEFSMPAGGIPGEVLASLGLSHSEINVVNDASDNERWATLLRLLAPPTKVKM